MCIMFPGSSRDTSSYVFRGDLRAIYGNFKTYLFARGGRIGHLPLDPRMPLIIQCLPETWSVHKLMFMCILAADSQTDVINIFKKLNKEYFFF